MLKDLISTSVIQVSFYYLSNDIKIVVDVWACDPVLNPPGEDARFLLGILAFNIKHKGRVGRDIWSST